MNLKERLEQSSAWVLMSYVTGAFIMGILVTLGFMQVLHQDQPKKQVAEFSIESGKQPETGQFLQRLKIEMDKSSISENTENKPIEYGDIFRPGDPIPIDFEQLKVGMRLSVLQSILPDGRLLTWCYIVDIKNNPVIYLIRCYVDYDDDKMIDGTINRFEFWINSEARGYLTKQALSKFGAEKANSKLQGKILEWKNVKGFHVEIGDDGYIVESQAYAN